MDPRTAVASRLGATRDDFRSSCVVPDALLKKQALKRFIRSRLSAVRFSRLTRIIDVVTRAILRSSRLKRCCEKQAMRRFYRPCGQHCLPAFFGDLRSKTSTVRAKEHPKCGNRFTQTRDDRTRHKMSVATILLPFLSFVASTSVRLAIGA